VAATYDGALDIYGDVLTLANVPDAPYLGPPRYAGTAGASSGALGNNPALHTEAAPLAQGANVAAGQASTILDAHQDFAPVLASVDHGWVLPH
jgi:hypothetical protein